MPKLVTIVPVSGSLYLVAEVSGLHPDQGLPVYPGRPDQGLPGSPGHPDNSLPLDPAHPGQLPVWPGYPTTGPVFPGKPVDPGFGVPPGNVWWPVDPGYGRPVRPPRPGHELPGHGIPGIPDNTLPTTPPPTVPPGTVLVIVRTPDGKWVWGTGQQGTITPLPVPPPTAAPKS